MGLQPRVKASAVTRAYSVGQWAMLREGSSPGAKAQEMGQGAKPPEAESNLKTK